MTINPWAEMIALQTRLSGNELALNKICLAVQIYDEVGIAFGTTHVTGTHRVGLFADGLKNFLTKKQLTDTLSDEQIDDMATYMYNSYLAYIIMYAHFYMDAYAPELDTSDSVSETPFVRTTARKFYNRLERLPVPLWVLSLAREVTKPVVMVDYDAQPVMIFPFGGIVTTNLDAIIDKLEGGKKFASYLRTYGINMVTMMRSRDFDTSKHHEAAALQNLVDPDRLDFWLASYPGVVNDSSSGNYYFSSNDFSYDNIHAANRKYLIFNDTPSAFFTIPGLTVPDAPITEMWNVATAYQQVIGKGTGFDSMFGVTQSLGGANEGYTPAQYKDASDNSWSRLQLSSIAEAEAWVLWFVGFTGDDTGTLFDGRASWDAAGLTDPGMHQGVIPFYTMETVELPSSYDQEDMRDSTVLYIESVIGGGGSG
jgi:hypothetical protein